MTERRAFVICEPESPAALELIGRAREFGMPVTALLLAAGMRAPAYLHAGADEALLLQLSEEALVDDAATAAALCRVLRARRPEIVLFAATVRGRAIAPYVAALLNTGLTADCTGLSLRDGLLCQTRPAYGGDVLVDILCRSRRPQMASVRPRVFPPPEMDERRTGSIEEILHGEIAVRVRRTQAARAGGPRLADAGVIVAGGRGVGSAAGFEKLGRLAARLGGELAASRGAVDAGFAPCSRQVGLTGIVVRPRLYVAFGISGAVQHLAGMRGAATVVAVNSAPDAGIFDQADYGVVDDWKAVADACLDALG